MHISKLIATAPPDHLRAAINRVLTEADIAREDPEDTMYLDGFRDGIYHAVDEIAYVLRRERGEFRKEAS